MKKKVGGGVVGRLSGRRFVGHHRPDSFSSVGKKVVKNSEIKIHPVSSFCFFQVLKVFAQLCLRSDGG